MRKDDCPYAEVIEHLKESVNKQDVRNSYESEDIKTIKTDLKAVKAMITNGYLEDKINASIERYIGKLTIKFLLAAMGSGGVVAAIMTYIVNLFA